MAHNKNNKMNNNAYAISYQIANLMMNAARDKIVKTIPW